MINRILEAGFDTVAQWRDLALGWRRSFFATGTISYPPVVRNAIVDCVKSNSGG